jgi:acyl carrier protein
LTSAAELEQIEQSLQGFVSSLRIDDDDSSGDVDEDLLRTGRIDSMGILEVVSFIEEKFGVSVDDVDIVPDNFSSVREMTRYVAEKKGISESDVPSSAQLPETEQARP